LGLPRRRSGRPQEPTYKRIDEWLCEYVDGTTDPSLEPVFEKYVEANPELKAHVERLRKTREVLVVAADRRPHPTSRQPTERTRLLPGGTTSLHRGRHA
jgi:anti-sigma factor RsiW